MIDLSQFKKTLILIFGDVMLDRYWWGSISRISPEAPVPIVKLERTSMSPGGAANVAVNAASLGSHVILIGPVGSDDESDALKNAIEQCGISSEHLVSIPDRRTSVKTRILAHNQQVTRIDVEDTEELSVEQSAEVVAKLTGAMAAVDLVIVSDYAKGSVSPYLLERIFSLGRSQKIPVIVDPKGKDFKKYEGAFLLTPNRREAAEACKLEDTDPRVSSLAGSRLLSELDFPNVLITESERGVTLFRRDESPLHFDAISKDVFDVTGAGDAVIATVGVAIAAGFSIDHAVELANIAGGIAVGHIGTSAIRLADLEVLAARHTRGVSKS